MMMDYSALAAAVAFHESMTAPDKEDWTILPLEEQRVLVVAYREDAERNVFCRAGEALVADVKNAVRNLPADHNLGAVTIFVTADHERCGGHDLTIWLMKAARKKNFSLTSFVMPGKTTAQEARERVIARLAQQMG